MTKKGLFLLFFIASLIFISFNYSKNLKEKAFLIPHTIRGVYIDFRNSVHNKIDEHFKQIEMIKKLQKELKEAKREVFLKKAYQKRLNKLLSEQNITLFDPSMELVQAISYVKLSDYNKIWIEYKDFNKTKIYGLVKGERSAGVVIEKNSVPLALLQGDKKCTFSVVVGDLRAPGIIFGDKEKMIIKFIPPWMSISVGDEVITSGLDNIFIEGIKVGKVIEIIEEESFTTAYVKPYYNSTTIPSFFHIININN